MPTRYTHYLNGGPREKFPRARSKEGLRVERLRLGGWPRSTLGLDTGCDTWGGAFNAHGGEDAALGLQEVGRRVRDP